MQHLNLLTLVIELQSTRVDFIASTSDSNKMFKATHSDTCQSSAIGLEANQSECFLSFLFLFMFMQSFEGIKCKFKFTPEVTFRKNRFKLCSLTPSINHFLSHHPVVHSFNLFCFIHADLVVDKSLKALAQVSISEEYHSSLTHFSLNPILISVFNQTFVECLLNKVFSTQFNYTFELFV